MHGLNAGMHALQVCSPHLFCLLHCRLVCGSAQSLCVPWGWCRLQSYCGVVEKAVEELSESLTAAAASNQVVDMSAACSNLTLKAIGEAAFG